jgi:hypothetical protein
MPVGTSAKGGGGGDGFTVFISSPSMLPVLGSKLGRVLGKSVKRSNEKADIIESEYATARCCDFTKTYYIPDLSPCLAGCNRGNPLSRAQP